MKLLYVVLNLNKQKKPTSSAPWLPCSYYADFVVDNNCSWSNSMSTQKLCPLMSITTKKPQTSWSTQVRKSLRKTCKQKTYPRYTSAGFFLHYLVEDECTYIRL